MRLLTGIALLGLVSITYAYSTARVANLVGEISAGNFAAAVQTTLQLQREKKSKLIKEAIDGLFQNSERNLFEYAYRLRQDGGAAIARRVLPASVQRILDSKLMKLVNKQDGRALKLARTTDQDGDRKAYGDGRDSVLRTIAWRFTPIWENNNMYFQIFGIDSSQYLKLGYSADGMGDHTAYGGNNPTDDRYKWYLVPARSNGVNLFYIVNKHFNQALKLGRAVDNEDDRIAYGHNGYYHGNPEQLGWRITNY